MYTINHVFQRDSCHSFCPAVYDRVKLVWFFLLMLYLSGAVSKKVAVGFFKPPLLGFGKLENL